jgi:translocation and assembly module TamB
MYKQIRRFLYVPLALAVLFLAGLVTVTTPWFHRYLEKRVAAELHSLTGARVEIGQMHFSLFVLQITLENLVLHGSEKPSDPPLFRAQTLAVRFRPLSVLRRQMKLGALDLNAAQIHIVSLADGSTNLPGPMLSSAEVSGSPLGEFLDLAIQRLTINHTDVYWNNQRFDLNVRARNVALQMRHDSARAYQGSLSSNSFEYSSSPITLSPTTLSARFEITTVGIDITSLNWRSGGFSGQATIHMKAAQDMHVEGVFNARAAAVTAGKIFGLANIAAGEIYANGHATYEQGKWQANGRLEGRQVRLASRAFQPGKLEFNTDYSADPQKLVFPNLHLLALGGLLSGKGEILFPQGPPRFSVKATLRGVQLRPLLNSLSNPYPVLNHLRWTSTIGGTLNASWEGQWQKLNSQLALDLRASGNPAGAYLPVNGAIRAKLSREKNLALEIQQLDAQTPHSSLSVHGSAQALNSQLSLELKTSDLADWRAPMEFLTHTTEPIPLELKDPLSFSATLTEAQGVSSIQGRISSGKFNFHGWNWDEFAAQVSLDPAAFTISGASLRSENSQLHLTASAALKDWQFAPDQPLDILVNCQKMPLASLQEALGSRYPLEGLATGQLELKAATSLLSGSGDMVVENGSLAGHAFDRLSANLRITNSAWNIENLQLTRAKSKIVGNGTFDSNSRAFTARLRGTDISLADVELGPTSRLQDAAKHPIEGRAAFDLEGSGTPENVALHGQWNIQDLVVAGTPAGSFRGKLNWHGRNLEATGESAAEGDALHFSGRARTEGDWPAELTGNFSDFRFGPWIRLLLNGKFDSSVMGSGSVKMTGPLLRPKQLVVESQVARLAIKSSDLTWTNAQPIDLRYTSGRLNIGRFHLQGPSTNLEVEGSVRFGEQSSLALSAKGDSDAKFLGLLDPAVKATGSSKVDLIINGTPLHPLLFGNLGVQDLNLTYGDFPIRLFGMNGEIRLEGERATVQSLRGTSGGGTVNVQGYMTFGALPRFEVTAQVDQVRMQYPTDFVSVLSGALRLAGTSRNSRMEGELTIRQLHASPDFTVLGLLSDVGASPATPPIGAASPVASKVQLNVQVVSSPTVRLEAQDLTIVADVDLHLQGTLANPVVVGGIHILNGEAVVRGNRYKLNRADISMTNPFRTQPTLDLEATTRVQQYDLTMDVSGALDRFKIAYRSDPPLPTSDILSLLALGYSRQQEQAATMGNERTSTVGASALLSEALSSQTSGRIQRLFGVSRIRIDPNVGGPENIAGARVTVEQQVTRQLTLTYITDTGSSQRRVIQFEWQVNDNASLLGIRDRNGIFGVELRFRSRFK